MIFLRFELKNNHLQATIDMKGAELKSLKDQEFEYIWTSDPKYWHRSAPFLFPAIGRFMNDQTLIGGKPYHIPKHGFIKDMRFSVLHQTEEAITLVFDATDETLKMYPFQFRFLVTYSLNGDSLETHLQVINTGDQTMPFNLGGHPAFSCPIDPKDSFTDYELYFPNQEQFVSPLVNMTNGTIDWSKTNMKFDSFQQLPLEYSLFKQDALIFDKPVSDYCILRHKSKPLGIKFSFPTFNTLGIWTPATIDSPFVCLEPWIGCADKPDTKGNFEEKKDMIFLPPNQSFEAIYSIHIMK